MTATVATVSVVIPALNEEGTVGQVVESLRPLQLGTAPLIDEILVIDSDSTDATALVAARAGATVVNWRSVLPHIPPQPGKGEALWRGVAAARGDIVCFMDADVVEPGPQWVATLVQPLLADSQVQMVRGSYQRVLSAGQSTSLDGGRVTELTMRPLLAALRPELATIAQPLGGEYAARRVALCSVPFAPGYGVETGLLLDFAERFGVSAIAQVDLGQRRHRNRTLADLGPMARQVVATLFDRCGVPDSGAPLRVGGVAAPVAPSFADRPPIASVIASMEGSNSTAIPPLVKNE